MEGNKQKKERSSNFSQQEKDLLLEIVLEHYKDVIESKKTDKVTTAKKTQAWKELSGDFNSQNIGTDRDWKNLKLCYENIKKRSKKALAHDKVELYKTGGGCYVRPTATESEQKLIAALKPQFCPLSNRFDDDADFHPEVICTDSTSRPIAGCSSMMMMTGHEEIITDANIVPITDNEANVYIDQVDAQHASNDSAAVPENYRKSKRLENMTEVKSHFYKRRLECLEREHELKMQCTLAEHKLRMETLELDKGIKELQLKKIKGDSGFQTETL